MDLLERNMGQLSPFDGDSFIVGKFYPPHNGHIALIRRAYRETNGMVYVCIGSAECVSVHITYLNRRNMLEKSLDGTPIRFVPLCDIGAADRDGWANYVRCSILTRYPKADLRVYYTGSQEDAGWMCGPWVTRVVDREQLMPGVSGTIIRKRMMGGEDISAYVPREVLTTLTTLWR